MKNIPLKPADILLPNVSDMQKWSVVACDQYTSEPEYWKSVENFVNDSPSSLRLILPELYLESDDCDSRIEKIHSEMEEYLKKNIFVNYEKALIYVERTLLNGTVRKGIIGSVDLEEYDYSKGSKSLIRATEGTVTSRIPPRLKVRNNATLELPHILILIDDVEKTVVESIDKTKLKKLYDFDLMKNGGHIEGYLIENADEIFSALNAMYEKLDMTNPLFFAVGDGNHSLATAKAYWEKIKTELSEEESKYHPARYALAEIGNLHDDSLVFEPIHRVVFNCNPDNLLASLKKFYNTSKETGIQSFEAVFNGKCETIYISNPKSNLAVGSLQIFLDEYAKENDIKVDYIHGKGTVHSLTKEENTIGFLLPPMDKSDLFKTVISDGALPRKTFSMGEASEKRYYLEARKISK